MKLRQNRFDGAAMKSGNAKESREAADKDYIFAWFRECWDGN